MESDHTVTNNDSNSHTPFLKSYSNPNLQANEITASKTDLLSDFQEVELHHHVLNEVNSYLNEFSISPTTSEKFTVEKFSKESSKEPEFATTTPIISSQILNKSPELKSRDSRDNTFDGLNTHPYFESTTSGTIITPLNNTSNTGTRTTNSREQLRTTANRTPKSNTRSTTGTSHFEKTNETETNSFNEFFDKTETIPLNETGMLDTVELTEISNHRSGRETAELLKDQLQNLANLSPQFESENLSTILSEKSDREEIIETQSLATVGLSTVEDVSPSKKFSLIKSESAVSYSKDFDEVQEDPSTSSSTIENDPPAEIYKSYNSDIVSTSSEKMSKSPIKFSSKNSISSLENQPSPYELPRSKPLVSETSSSLLSD